MRISDWSSDVCSSDLGVEGEPPPEEGGRGIDRHVERREPRRAKLVLVAERRRCPLGRGPNRRQHAGEHHEDLAPEDFGGGHGPYYPATAMEGGRRWAVLQGAWSLSRSYGGCSVQRKGRA